MPRLYSKFVDSCLFYIGRILVHKELTLENDKSLIIEVKLDKQGKRFVNIFEVNYVI